jgi:hypothetical protein
MIRSLILRTSAALASATLAFLVIAPVAAPLAQGRNMNFPDACSVTVDGSGNVTMTCGSPPPPGALSCFISGAPGGQVAPNSTVSLAMSCTGGTAPYRYLWSPGGATSATIATTVAATTTFTVTATDSANVTSTQSVTVTVSSGGGGGGGGTGLCGQYPNVLPTVNVTWGQQGLSHSSQSGNFGDNTIWVFKLIVPPGTPNSTVFGYFNAVEDNGPGTFRQMTISTQACDFRQKDYTGVNGPLGVSNGVSVALYYGVATPFIFGNPGLTAGQTYYVSVRNWQLDPFPQSSCLQTSCNAVMNEIPAAP